MDRVNPPVFVDGVGLGSYIYIQTQFVHESFAELRERIASRYELAGEVLGTRVYVSKARLAELSVRAPLVSEVPFPVVPAATNQVTWKGGTAECSGKDSYLTFALKQPEHIQGIRLRFSYEFATWKRLVNVRMKLKTRTATRIIPIHDEFDAFRSATLTIPVDDVTDTFQIYPDGEPCAFKLEQVDLLVRPGDRARLVKDYVSWGYEQPGVSAQGNRWANLNSCARSAGEASH